MLHTGPEILLKTRLCKSQVPVVMYEMLLGASITAAIEICEWLLPSLNVWEGKKKQGLNFLVAFLYWSLFQLYFISVRLLPPSGESNVGCNTGICQSNNSKETT